MAGTWDWQHDRLCDFPTSFCSGHGTHFTRCSKYVKTVMKNEHLTLPPSRDFMDDIIILIPSQIAADGLLQRYYDLFTWARMKAKPKKSRSLSLVGGSVREIYFKIGGDKIPTVREKPVKSLRCLYSIPLTDRHRGTEVEKVALKGLKSTDKTCLPGKMKAWCYQHGLLPWLLWPFQMYEIAISRIEWIQQYSNKYLHKWLGVPPCFSKVALYTNSGNLQFPISSLVEEFKIGKVHLHMMKDSADKIIRKVYPEIKSGMKWLAVKAAHEAECSLRIKDIIGVTQTNRAGLGSMSKKVFSKVGPKGKRYGERRNQDVWGRAKKSQCCYSGQTMCLDKMEWYWTN